MGTREMNSVDHHRHQSSITLSVYFSTLITATLLLDFIHSYACILFLVPVDFGATLLVLLCGAISSRADPKLHLPGSPVEMYHPPNPNPIGSGADDVGAWL